MSTVLEVIYLDRFDIFQLSVHNVWVDLSGLNRCLFKRDVSIGTEAGIFYILNLCIFVEHTAR